MASYSDPCCQLKLFNPITGVTNNLPLLSMVGVVHDRDSHSFEIEFEHYVVLCRTPCNLAGVIAIALFSDGLLAYTCEGVIGWKLLRHPMDYAGCNKYFPEVVYMDDIVYKNRV